MDFVEAGLNYLDGSEGKPFISLYPPGNGERNGRWLEKPMRIAVGDRNAPLSLEEQGFVLKSHTSAVADFYNDAQIRDVYYPELQRLVGEVCRARKVVVFDHTIRSARKRENTQDPVWVVHNDYTMTSGPRRVRDMMDGEAEQTIEAGFAIVNIWRPIVEPVEATPLAICDARSLSLSQFVATDLRFQDRIGEVYSLKYNPDNRWTYFRQMRRSEALIFKCFDSRSDGRARFTAHSAFDDPTSPNNPRPRESIEVRCIVVFGG